MLLDALEPRERAELTAEAARLLTSGRLNARTTWRLALCALGLGRAETRALALDRYHAADCDVLLTGYVLEGAVAGLFGERLGMAIQVALRELGPHAPAAPAEPAAPTATAEPGLLPAGFTIDGEDLDSNAINALGHRDPDAQHRRLLFADAIRAHAAGTLAQWMADHHEASIAEGV